MVRVPFLFHDYFMSIRTSWKSVTRHNKGEMTSTRSSTRARHVAQHVAQPCTGPLGTQPLSALPAFPGSLGDCSHQVWPAAHSSGWGCSTFHIRKWGRRGRLGGQRGGFFHWSKREKKGPDKTILANLVTICTLRTDHMHTEDPFPGILLKIQSRSFKLDLIMREETANVKVHKHSNWYGTLVF